ncbi:MAG: glycosyltransferase, partial [Methylophilaceae bacterium]
MRVAFFIHNPATNAMAAIVLSWIKQLATQYPDDRYLVLSESPLSSINESIPIEQVSIVKVPHRYRLFPFWADAALYKKLFSFRPNLLVTTYPQQFVFDRWKPVRVTAEGGLIARGVETSFIPFPTAAYALLSSEEKHALKEKWSFGREFFLLVGPLPSELQLTLLLQAFSIFKHRQQSGLRLILPFSISDHYPTLAKKIDQYKYRNALVITGSIASVQMAQLAGAAYALVAPGPPGSALLAAVQAWQVGVPLLALTDGGLSTVARESVLIAAAPTKEALAAIMMQIYKDESLRLQLIRSGQQAWATIDITAETSKLRTKLQ